MMERLHLWKVYFYNYSITSKWFIHFLIIASSYGCIEVVKELLDRGASVKPVTYIDSQSALHKGIYILS